MDESQRILFFFWREVLKHVKHSVSASKHADYHVYLQVLEGLLSDYVANDECQHDVHRCCDDARKGQVLLIKVQVIRKIDATNVIVDCLGRITACLEQEPNLEILIRHHILEDRKCLP